MTTAVETMTGGPAAATASAERSAATAAPQSPRGPVPTIWGLQPVKLHDHFWAARGVHVVRQGEPADISREAEIYLLTDPRTFVMFRMRLLVETLSWSRPQVTYVRVRSLRERGYQEQVLTDRAGGFVKFQRIYEGYDPRLARIALTRDPEVALEWQQAGDVRQAWLQLRQRTRRARREVMVAKGRVYDGSNDAEAAQYVRDLVSFWARPSTSIGHITKVSPGVWAHERALVAASSRFIGPVWVGAGRSTEGARNVLGPAVLWDAPEARPAAKNVDWQDLEPSEASIRVVRPRPRRSVYATGKRAFDVAFALAILSMTLPLYPFVILAIWLEDGRPFFFGHRRETLGGREFPCIKFRSMRKDADRIKAQLIQANQADGPQFYMEQDPRLTRVGRIIRKLNIDELPQFLNVLMGHMSVVGPRPSPRAENQFCPPWREARLSVPPGITGLWQVRRTRRKGYDFQEWIKYDLEYVETAGWRIDLKIIFQTAVMLLRGGGSIQKP